MDAFRHTLASCSLAMVVFGCFGNFLSASIFLRVLFPECCWKSDRFRFLSRNSNSKVSKSEISEIFTNPIPILVLFTFKYLSSFIGLAQLFHQHFAQCPRIHRHRSFAARNPRVHSAQFDLVCCHFLNVFMQFVLYTVNISSLLLFRI